MTTSPRLGTRRSFAFISATVMPALSSIYIGIRAMFCADTATLVHSSTLRLPVRSWEP